MSDVGLTVAVCGAGAMGLGIAQVAAQAGHPVIVFDPFAAALQRGRELFATNVTKDGVRGRLREPAEAVIERVVWTDVVDGLASAGLVIEAIVEDKAVKSALFDTIEAVVADTAMLMSNTSSLSVTELAAGRRVPGRFGGMHFFNPAPVMKLVEVVAGASTDSAVADRIVTLATAWGKVAVPVRDVPGFIVNRVARPYYAEGFRAWGENVAAPEAIDALLRGAGFRMGPLELADMIGHDVNYAVARSVYEAYFGQTQFVPQPAQSALVAAGWYGRKVGQGVYTYDGTNLTAPEPMAAPTASLIVAGHALDAGFTRLAGSASNGDVPDGMVDVDGILITSVDGRMAATLAEELGRPVGVIDWFGEQATAIGVSGSNPDAVRAAASLASRAGLPIHAVADRPGHVVLRTLAQLANAAGAAVRDQVANADGVDLAMRYGANYPFGPLAWAKEFGHARLRIVLNRIASGTGDGIYAASEYFRRTQ